VKAIHPTGVKRLRGLAWEKSRRIFAGRGDLTGIGGKRPNRAYEKKQRGGGVKHQLEKDLKGMEPLAKGQKVCRRGDNKIYLSPRNQAYEKKATKKKNWRYTRCCISKFFHLIEAKVQGDGARVHILGKGSRKEGGIAGEKDARIVRDRGRVSLKVITSPG